MLLYQLYSHFFYSSSSSTTSPSSSEADDTVVATVHGVYWRNTAGPVVEELNHISSSTDEANIPSAGTARLLSAQANVSRALDAFLLFPPPSLITSILSATTECPTSFLWNAARQ